MAAREWLTRLIREDGGQDMVEYALLAAIVGVAGAATFPQIETAIGLAFTGTNDAAYNIWCPKDPGGGATCSVAP